MSNRLSHRGPDHQRSIVLKSQSGKNLGLGHALLQIFGKVGEGIQPFVVVNTYLVFNGAIYNFESLKADLLKQGAIFKTSTDTEVLAWGLILEGKKFLTKTRGMFSFAFFDPATDKLLLARDPLGVKPLYYSLGKDFFCFASEYKAIIPYLPSPTVNHGSINDYLRLRYVPGSETLVSEIKKVTPGTVIEIALKDFSFFTEKYFQIEHTSNDLSPNFFEILKRSIERRAVASVPVASLLSGGIDSSVVCDFLEPKIQGMESYTLSVGKDHDESSIAKKIAKRIGINNTILHSSPSAISDLRRLAYHLDDPYGDPIILALDQIFKTIKGKQRVLVTGEGADELFSGYVHHRAAGLLDRIPSPFVRIGILLLSLIPLGWLRWLLPYAGKLSKEDFNSALQRLKGLRLNKLSSFQSIFYLFGNEQLQTSLTNLSSKIESNERFKLDHVRAWDFKYWLPDSQLFKLDKISMASSIEAREPFVDQDLVSAIQQLPAKVHVSLTVDKPFFRTLLRNKTRIGEDIINSRKTSFFQPFDATHMGSLPGELESLVRGKKLYLQQFLKPEAISQLLDNKDLGLLQQKRIFALGMLILWSEEVFSLANSGDTLGSY